jgi:carbonic anhydrase
VARRVSEGTLQLHGMYFHVAEAQAYILDGSTSVFSAVRPDAAAAAALGTPFSGGTTAEGTAPTKV